MFPDRKRRATQDEESVHVIGGCTVTWSALSQRIKVKKGFKKPATKPTGMGVRQLPHGTIAFCVCAVSGNVAHLLKLERAEPENKQLDKSKALKTKPCNFGILS